MKPKFFMMVGISGSGKSSTATTISKFNNVSIFSSDNIRKEIYGDENIQDNPSKVFEILEKRVRNSLRRGKSCIYDATNLLMRRRKAFLDSIKNIDCEKICVIVATPYDVCLSQDLTRYRTVGEKVIERQRKLFQVPYFYEGWDKIIICNEHPMDIQYLDDLVKKTKEIEHDNPYHEYTIGEHMLAAEDYCGKRAIFAMEHILDMNNNEENKQFYLEERNKWLFCCHIAKYHDIGKIATKAFIDNKGNPSDIAHYYNHQNVSSYEIISHIGCGVINSFDGIPYIERNKKEWFVISVQDWLIISMLVCWHMEPFFKDEESKSWKKFINLIGKDFGELLLYFHKADINSH